MSHSAFSIEQRSVTESCMNVFIQNLEFKKKKKRKKDAGPVHVTLITLQCSAEVIATFLAVLRQVKINHVRKTLEGEHMKGISN